MENLHMFYYGDFKEKFVLIFPDGHYITNLGLFGSNIGKVSEDNMDSLIKHAETFVYNLSLPVKERVTRSFLESIIQFLDEIFLQENNSQNSNVNMSDSDILILDSIYDLLEKYISMIDYI